MVSEIGDHFNNIAVLSLAMEHKNPGIVVTGVFLSRAIPMLAAGPIAGVLLDRLDRKRVMIASDLTRAMIALGFILCIHQQTRACRSTRALRRGLMFASPFFTSGRSSILPSITTPEELHTANTMTQTTSWASLTVGAFLGAAGAQYGYRIAFAFNALSFVVSALCNLGFNLRRPEGLPGRGNRRTKKEETGLRSVPRRAALYAGNAAAVWPRHGQCGLGQRRGRGADPVHSVRREGFQRGTAGNSVRDLGFCAVFRGPCLSEDLVGYWLGKRLNFVQYKRTP